MMRFLLTATKAAGLTYQLMTTTVLIGALAVGLVRAARGKKAD